jgi:transcriptional regulator with XRE-family HTH domain
MQQLGQRVRERRKALRLTQEATARRAGVTLSAVQKLEHGVVQDPRISTIEAIAGALDLELVDLVRDPLPLADDLLDAALAAARKDRNKDQHALNRQIASEGADEVISGYGEDAFRAALRHRGYPSEDVDVFIWPLIVRVGKLEAELDQLRQNEKVPS